MPDTGSCPDCSQTQLQFEFSPPSSTSPYLGCACSDSQQSAHEPVEVEVGTEANDLDLIPLSSSYHGPSALGSTPRQPAQLLNAGKKVHLDDFMVLSVLGQGGYGKVYLVENTETKEIFAMKCMKKGELVEKNCINYVHDEKSVLVAASHPFIWNSIKLKLVHLRYAFQTPAKLYLILDFIPGGELFSRLNAENFFLEPMAVFYAAEIVLAISHLHSRNIIYRDLKPENLLIQTDGHICLTDFGLAKPLNVEGTRTLCGTLAYLAPEVVSRKNPYGKPADWWSLGILLFEMLTGQIPFDSADRNVLQKKILTQKINYPKHVSNNAKSLLKRMLCREPSVRLGSKGDQEIRSHPFFKPINWDNLEKKLIPPPFVPDLMGPYDTRYFDSEITGMPLHSPADAHTISEEHQHHFIGFSFQR